LYSPPKSFKRGGKKKQFGLTSGKVLREQKRARARTQRRAVFREFSTVDLVARLRDNVPARRRKRPI